MKLVFDIVKNGKNIPAKRNFHFDGVGGVIGRSEECDWVLTDPNSYISGFHARILFKHGTYFIIDESINGVYLKNPYKKLPKGNPIEINASDVFIIGDHELQARYSNNDFSKDDIIGSFDVEIENDNIIPDDDFFSESFYNESSPSNDYSSDDMDIINVTQAPSENNSDSEADFFKIPDEFEIGIDENGDITEEMRIKPKEDTMQDHIDIPRYNIPESQVKKTEVASNDISGLVESISILEKILGIEITSLKMDERNLLMKEIGDILINTFDTLNNSLLIKDKTKQDLHISSTYMDLSDSNPIRLGSSVSKLLQSTNHDGMSGKMKISDAITKSFNELDMHCIALHSATKNMMKIVGSKFAPKNLEYKFESTGALKGVLPKQQLMWKAYSDMLNNLNDHPEDGIAMIQDDFAKEYESISYALKLNSKQNRSTF